MKKLIACFLLSAIALFADVTGKWSGSGKAATSDGDADVIPLTLELTQNGKDVTGYVVTGASGERYQIKNGALDGDSLKMDVVTDSATYRVTLTVDGDQMKGEAAGEHDGAKVTVKLELKRES
jgi:hypothetical protein